MEIGINVMSSMGAMREDFEGTVVKLKNGGCTFFEAMSDWGARPETIAFFSNLTGGDSGWDIENTVRRLEILKKHDMSIKGSFVFDEILEEQAEDLGKYCKEYGIGYIVFTFLKYENIDDIYNKIALIKNVSAVLKKYGVQTLLHNHEHDSLPILDKDGVEKPIMSVFLEQCSASELMLEIDTGWLVYAGLDEVAYVKENLDRIAVLHLKDLCKEYQTLPRDTVFVPCGKGVVNFSGILEAAKSRTDMIYVLDQDNSRTDITEDNIESIRYINSLRSE